MSALTHIIGASDAHKKMRLDKFLTASLPSLSRSRLQALIEQGHVSCDGKKITDANHKVKIGHTYVVTVPEVAPSHIVAQYIRLDIIYEDKHLLVINKPAGLTVHPAPGHPDNTLVNALLAHCGESLSGIGGVARPGIVHRIDKETSGLLVVAKNDAAHAALSKQLAERTLKRTYNAIVWGTPKPAAGKITGNIGRSPKNRQKMAVLKTGGKEATTHYKTLKTLAARPSPLAALIECQLESGRTHQIRVHLLHIGHPLVGDPVYGQSTRNRLKSGIYKALSPESKTALIGFERQALHAKELELIHPATGKKMHFESELPADMQALLHTLQSS